METNKPAETVEAISQPSFSIRELCDAFEVTPRALRFYEAEGLLSPIRDGQRRIYSVRDRARLKLILRGRRFGFKLAEIRELLDLYDLGDGQVAQLTLTLEKAGEKLTLLEENRREIETAIGDLKQQMTIVEKMLQERRSAAPQAMERPVERRAAAAASRR